MKSFLKRMFANVTLIEFIICLSVFSFVSLMFFEVKGGKKVLADERVGRFFHNGITRTSFEKHDYVIFKDEKGIFVIHDPNCSCRNSK